MRLRVVAAVATTTTILACIIGVAACTGGPGPLPDGQSGETDIGDGEKSTSTVESSGQSGEDEPGRGERGGRGGNGAAETDLDDEDEKDERDGG